MTILTDILATVQATHTNEQKLITIMNGLAATNATLSTQLAAALAANDTTTISAISDQLGAISNDIQTAVAANTPAPAPSAPTVTGAASAPTIAGAGSTPTVAAATGSDTVTMTAG